MIATTPTLSFSASFRLRSPSTHDIHQSAVSSPRSRISSPRPCTHISAAYASSPTTSARERQYSPPPSLYDLLEVDVGATGREIKAAYRRKVKVCHPDTVPVYQKDTSADHFMEVHAAYSALSDPVKRADYDRSLLVVPNRLHVRPGFYYNSEGSGSFSPSQTTSRFTGRTWETDQCW